MFSKKSAQPQVVSMLPGYSFEFYVETGLPISIWGEDAPVARFTYTLFRGKEAVEQGTYNMFMTETRVEQKIFLFALKRARKDFKRMSNERAFPYATDVTHQLPSSMEIDADLLNDTD